MVLPVGLGWAAHGEKRTVLEGDFDRGIGGLDAPRLRNDGTGVRTVNPICVKVVVQSEDATEIQLLGCYNQRGVGQIHW